MIKAVFFDLDDTLVNSRNPSDESTFLAYKYFGFDYKEVKSKSKDFNSMGRKVSEVLKIRRDRAGITELQIPLSKLFEIREKYFLKMVSKKTTLYPGVMNLLKILKDRKIIIGIVSSGTKAYIDLVIKKFYLKSFIDFIISGDDVKKGKPNPECYEKAFRYLNEKYGSYKKEECLVIEDTESGIIAGHDAGLKTLIVPSKYSVIPKTVKPDYQIKSLGEFDSDLL